jgi:hypothetical protein
VHIKSVVNEMRQLLGPNGFPHNAQSIAEFEFFLVKVKFIFLDGRFTILHGRISSLPSPPTIHKPSQA